MLMKCLNLHWNNRLANKELYGHVDKLTNKVHKTLTTGWSLLTAHCSLLTAHCSLRTGLSIQKDVCHCPSVDISDKMNREKQKKTCTEMICENLDIKLRDPSLHEQPSHIETTHPGSGVMMIMMMMMVMMMM